MKEQHLEYLLEKLADNTISHSDYEELMEYIVHAKSDKDLYNAMDQQWKRLDIVYPLTDSQSSDLFGRIQSDPRFNQEVGVIIPSRWSWLQVAASILFVSLLGAAIYFYTGNIKDKPAYIEKIVLHGSPQKFTLPDGSIIWVNSGSKLSYPADFNTGKTRELYLNGEAYFDVAHNPEKPFIVHTGKVSTTVLGTAFDIRAYNSEEIRVAVVRGKVSVNEGNRKLSILTPNKMMVYSLDNKQVTESEVKATRLTTWKEGELILDDTDMDHAAEIIGRKYNVEFSFTSSGLKQSKFTASFLENESITQVMDVIGELNHFEYRIEGKKIIVSEKK